MKNTEIANKVAQNWTNRKTRLRLNFLNCKKSSYQSTVRFPQIAL